MKRKTALKSVIALSLLSALLFNACSPLREFGNSPLYQGENNFHYPPPNIDPQKKTVVIVANNDGTELFDMMAPFYLFNATQQANVVITSEYKRPITVKKGLHVLPQATFEQLDSMKITPDVIVIPFLAIGDSAHQNSVIVNWIKQHYNQQVTILAVCDGAATAAATGIFDGKLITAHASDFEGIKMHFSKPNWVQHTSVVNTGNLYSTGGVSNATEGSLMVIRQLFGDETMTKVIKTIAYPVTQPRTQHASQTFQFRDRVSVAKKIFFKKNRKVGILIEPNINEFQLSGIIDTYNRTFPKSICSFSADNRPVKSRYGLTLIPTGITSTAKLDELHIIDTSASAYKESGILSKTIIHYSTFNQEYIIDQCLKRIRNEYGKRFEHIVRLMLDYN